MQIKEKPKPVAPRTRPAQNTTKAARQSVGKPNDMTMLCNPGRRGYGLSQMEA